MIVMTLSVSLQAQEIRVAPRVEMLALGDSYTIGESVGISGRWPHQFMEALRQLGVTGPDPQYIAVTGWTTGALLSALEGTDFSDREFNLVSVLIGVNNQYQGLDFGLYEPDLREILDRALEIVEGDTSRVFVLSIPDYAFTPFGMNSPGISEEINAYNAKKEQVVSEYGMAFVNITAISRQGLADPSLVAPDGLHPSATQYGLWVQEILPRIAPGSVVTGQDSPGSVSGLKVYPNPASGLVILDSSLSLSGARILDLQGKMVFETTVTGRQVQLDVSGLPAGTYILSVATGHSGHGGWRRPLVVFPQ